MTAEPTPNPAAPPAAPARRHSTGVVIGTGLAGVAIGALAVFATAAPTWKVRVELPTPPSPGLSTPPVSYLPPRDTATTQPTTSGLTIVPPPPLPAPGPR